MRNYRAVFFIGVMPVLVFLSGPLRAQLRAGIARVNVTSTDPAVVVNDSLYVKAMVLDDGHTRGAIITVDAVAIGEIGPIKNGYLQEVRRRLLQEIGIAPDNVLINASHCHGLVCEDIASKTVNAVKQAAGRLVPVEVGAGKGFENRIMENRRLRLANGREADVRHRYPLPPDSQVTGTGPVDPEIGIVRFNRKDGRPLAALYNFACHPIQGVYGKGRRDNTADFPGFASGVLEDNLGEGFLAFFLQGCAGDINPVFYKDVATPRSAEPLGRMLGLSTLEAFHRIRCGRSGTIRMLRETVRLPRADTRREIDSLKRLQAKLVDSIDGTSLDLKSFLYLYTSRKLQDDYPSAYAFNYMGEAGALLKRFDEENKGKMEAYVRNIHIMEALMRIKENLALLIKHQATNQAAGVPYIEVEITALKIGECVLVSFPGELSVQIGLNIKKKSPHKFTFITGCTNGYIYYAPTDEQLKNRGGAQEDSECLLGTGWQQLYEDKVIGMLKRI